MSDYLCRKAWKRPLAAAELPLLDGWPYIKDLRSEEDRLALSQKYILAVQRECCTSHRMWTCKMKPGPALYVEAPLYDSLECMID